VQLDRQRRTSGHTLLAYLHATHSFAVSVTPCVVSSRSSPTPCVGSLFSRYPSRPAWSLRGSSHMPCVGSLFSCYLSHPPWSLRGSSHIPCVGSLFLGSGGHSAGHGDREVGLWREIICNFNLLHSALQAMYAPPHHTAPMGFPAFQSRLKSQNKTKQTNSKSRSQHKEHLRRSSEERAQLPIYPAPPFVVKSGFQRTKAWLWGVKAGVIGAICGGVVSVKTEVC